MTCKMFGYIHLHWWGTLICSDFCLQWYNSKSVECPQRILHVYITHTQGKFLASGLKHFIKLGNGQVYVNWYLPFFSTFPISVHGPLNPRVHSSLFAAVLLLLQPIHFIGGRPGLPARGFKREVLQNCFFQLLSIISSGSMSQYPPKRGPGLLNKWWNVHMENVKKKICRQGKHGRVLNLPSSINTCLGRHGSF